MNQIFDIVVIMFEFIYSKIINLLVKIPFIKNWLDKKIEIYENTDTEAIKVSDISKYYGISMKSALFLCELACKQKLYSKNEDGTYKLINNGKTN